MIQANELRIGNWVSNGEKYFTVDISSLYDIGGGITDEIIEPIPLTHEILEKCGFVKENDGISPFYKLVINRTECISIEDDFSFGLNALNENSTQGYASSPDLCKYLHQLQNLYFALTGQELIYTL